jgi:hypothetical protein
MSMIFGQKKKKSIFSNLSGIASICSAGIICIRLGYYGILSVQWVAIIMVAVVIMVVIGNVATKFVICGVSIFLFAKIVSHGNNIQFQSVVGAILALLITFIGLYVMLRGIFR